MKAKRFRTILIESIQNDAALSAAFPHIELVRDSLILQRVLDFAKHGVLKANEAQGARRTAAIPNSFTLPRAFALEREVTSDGEYWYLCLRRSSEVVGSVFLPKDLNEPLETRYTYQGADFTLSALSVQSGFDALVSAFNRRKK